MTPDDRLVRSPAYSGRPTDRFDGVLLVWMLEALDQWEGAAQYSVERGEETPFDVLDRYFPDRPEAMGFLAILDEAPHVT